MYQKHPILLLHIVKVSMCTKTTTPNVYLANIYGSQCPFCIHTYNKKYLAPEIKCDINTCTYLRC